MLNLLRFSLWSNAQSILERWENFNYVRLKKINSIDEENLYNISEDIPLRDFIKSDLDLWITNVKALTSMPSCSLFRLLAEEIPVGAEELRVCELGTSFRTAWIQIRSKLLRTSVEKKNENLILKCHFDRQLSPE